MGLALTLRRAAVATVGAAALTALASLGLMVTTESAAASLIFEPFSLLFVPGIAVAIGWTNAKGHLQHHVRSVADNHDFSAGFVVWCTFLIYCVLFYWWQSRRRPAQTTELRSR